MPETKKAYQQLSRKYKLPKYEDIKKEFEISTIENHDFLLREIRRKIVDKLESYKTLLEETLQPDNTLSGMYESQFFDNKERKRMFDTYKDIMILIRTGINNALACSDKVDAEFINEAFTQWLKIKISLKEITQKLATGWTENVEKKFRVEYLG